MHHCLTNALATAVAITLLPAAPSFADSKTATPIKHLVVIFQENVSFDHYFGTYPHANGRGDSCEAVQQSAEPSLLVTFKDPLCRR